MAWAKNHVRTTEWVLEELYQTGRQLMSERARQRRYAPITSPVMAPREGLPQIVAGPPPAELDAELRQRFEQLVSEFVDRIEAA
jgi:hypothetical protein